MDSNTFKIKIPNSKPRNPLVALAHHRKAGSHRKSEKANRTNEKVALRKSLY